MLNPRKGELKGKEKGVRKRKNETWPEAGTTRLYEIRDVVGNRPAVWGSRRNGDLVVTVLAKGDLVFFGVGANIVKM